MEFTFDIETIKAFCRNRRIREFALFGSAVTGQMRPDSDVDVVLDFDPNSRHTLFDLVDMQEELENIFGRRVDIVTRKSLQRMRNRIRKAGIEATIRTIHAA